MGAGEPAFAEDAGHYRQKTVTDISQMTEPAARAFLREHPTACIQMDVWNEEILFQPTKRTSRSLRPGRLKRIAALAALGLGSPAFASGQAASDNSFVAWIASWFTEDETEPVEVEEEMVTPPPRVGPIRRLGGAPMPIRRHVDRD